MRGDLRGEVKRLPRGHACAFEVVLPQLGVGLPGEEQGLGADPVTGEESGGVSECLLCLGRLGRLAAVKMRGGSDAKQFGAAIDQNASTWAPTGRRPGEELPAAVGIIGVPELADPLFDVSDRRLTDPPSAGDLPGGGRVGSEPGQRVTAAGTPDYRTAPAR